MSSTTQDLELIGVRDLFSWSVSICYVMITVNMYVSISISLIVNNTRQFLIILYDFSPRNFLIRHLNERYHQKDLSLFFYAIFSTFPQIALDIIGMCSKCLN